MTAYDMHLRLFTTLYGHTAAVASNMPPMGAKQAGNTGSKTEGHIEADDYTLLIFYSLN